MNKDNIFVMRMDNRTRNQLDKLAEITERSRANVIRLLIHQKSSIGEKKETYENSPQQGAK